MSVIRFKTLLEELNESDYELTGDIPYDSIAYFLQSTGHSYLIEQDTEWTDDDIEEACEKSFGYAPKKIKSTIDELYELKRNGKDYSHLVDKLIYDVIGRI